MEYTSNSGLGLIKFGSSGWREDGAGAACIDRNLEIIDTIVTEIRQEVRQISVSGLPSNIDAGTFD